jgi:hypothetical protein
MSIHFWRRVLGWIGLSGGGVLLAFAALVRFGEPEGVADPTRASLVFGAMGLAGAVFGWRLLARADADAKAERRD